MSDGELPTAEFESRLEQAKLAALVEFAYGAGHEINNPLANIAARAQTLLEDETNPERRRKLAAIHRQAMRAHEMIADLMLFARPPKLALADLDLRQLAEHIVTELGEMARERSIELSCDVDNDLVTFCGDATQLSVAIAAVITNAIEAVGANGRVCVAVRAIHSDSEKCAVVIVRDNGPGISDQVRRHLFDPFFSGREAGRGLGFGLSKAWRIVTEHGGTLAAHNVPAGGAEFTLAFPAVPRQQC